MWSFYFAVLHSYAKIIAKINGKHTRRVMCLPMKPTIVEFSSSLLKFLGKKIYWFSLH